jgi:hypothetical protein
MRPGATDGARSFTHWRVGEPGVAFLSKREEVLLCEESVVAVASPV